MINAEQYKHPLDSRTAKIILFLVALATVLTLQFRVQLHTGFNVLYGDSYDATIVVAILEHWSNVLRGLSHWSEVSYFYPHTNTLGQTDGYFITGLIYTALKTIGFDIYTTSELVNVTLRGIGFVTFYLMARRIFKLSFSWALIGACLFVLSNNATAHGQRLQLATISLAPIMALLLWEAFQAFCNRNTWRLIRFGALASIFLGAWSITCFYITWFFIFFCTTFIIISTASSTSENLKFIYSNLKLQYKSIIFIALIAGLSLIPLLSVYLPKAAETGMRPYASAFSNTVPLEGIIQTGTENFMFGAIYNKALKVISPSYSPTGEYYNTGISPILFVLFLASVIVAFKTRTGSQSNFWNCIAGATCLTWLCTLNIFGYSAWYVIYKIFPGAKALNVVGAYQIFLSIPVIILASKYLQDHCNRVPFIIMAILVSLLALEEINSGYIQLNKKDELTKTQPISPPPASCESFFVSGWHNQDRLTPMAVWVNNYYAHNVSAMLIAEIVHIPTVNGVASFNPKDWNFGFPNNADYDERVRAYTQSHKLNNVCKLELNTLTWKTDW